MAGMTFLQRVTDFTYQHILPTLVDNVNGSNILFARTLAKPTDWLGPVIYQNITTGNSITGGSYAGTLGREFGVGRYHAWRRLCC